MDAPQILERRSETPSCMESDHACEPVEIDRIDPDHTQRRLPVTKHPEAPIIGLRGTNFARNRAAAFDSNPTSSPFCSFSGRAVLLIFCHSYLLIPAQLVENSATVATVRQNSRNCRATTGLTSQARQRRRKGPFHMPRDKCLEGERARNGKRAPRSQRPRRNLAAAEPHTVGVAIEIALGSAVDVDICVSGDSGDASGAGVLPESPVGPTAG